MNVISLATYAKDTMVNLVSRLGTDRDKASQTQFAVTLLSDLDLINAYRGSWLSRKIVDIPAFDSTRAWREWRADTESVIEPIENEENRLNLKGKIFEALVKARLWGGAAIFIGTGEANTMVPLDPERIGLGGIKYLSVISRRWLAAQEIDYNPESEWFRKPSSYVMASKDGRQQLNIHPSRLVIFDGTFNPDDEFVGGNLGWSDSVLQSCLDAIIQSEGTNSNVASLVFEAKIDVMKIPNFMAQVNDERYKTSLLNRFSLAATAKGINGVLLLDKEEEWESKTTQFGTLPDIMDRFMNVVSGAADIPVTRLLGQSPAGMNSTGESDLRNYYDRLSATQELLLTPQMHRLDECLIRSAIGSRDPSIYYEWAPLWQLSDKEKADIFKTKSDAGRALAGSAAGPLMPVEALSDSLVSAFVEDGSLPGLEAAIEEYGSLAEQEPSLEEQAAALSLQQQASNPPQRVAANDAAPRTLYVRRDVVNKADIQRWAVSQGFTDVIPDLHVTIIYSREPVDWFKVGTSWEDKIEIARGGPRQMEKFGEYAVLLIPPVGGLRWRHQEMIDLGASTDYPEYQPHISIQKGGNFDLSKMTPYQGKIVLGPEIFEEVKDD
jgi:phage-related protein (TIGR01555 family)